MNQIFINQDLLLEELCLLKEEYDASSSRNNLSNHLDYINRKLTDITAFIRETRCELMRNNLKSLSERELKYLKESEQREELFELARPVMTLLLLNKTLIN